jgi:hypothetical protein
VRIALLAVVLPAAGLVLMIGTMLVPDRLVMDGLFEAVESGTLSEDSYPFGYAGSRIDGFSECKRITIGLGRPAGTSVVETAVRTPSLGPCATAVPKIVGWAQGDGLTQQYSYFRYWNGSAVVLRPSVALFGVGGTRVVAAASLVIAAAAFWVSLGRRVGRTAASFAVAPIVLTTDFVDLPRALLHAIGFVVALGSAAVLLRFARPGAPPLWFGGAAFAAGAVFLFLGDMTNPDAAWALTAASCAVVATGTAHWRHVVPRLAAGAIGWIAGFAWMWLAKWAIAVPVVGYADVRSEVSGQVGFRIDGEAGGFTGSVTGGLQRAVDAWLDQPLTSTVLAVGAVGAVVVAWRAGDFVSTLPVRALVAAPAAIPVVWHLVLRNHSHFHSWFTYRSFAVSAGLGFLALTATIRSEPSHEVSSGGAGEDLAASVEAPASGQAQ